MTILFVYQEIPGPFWISRQALIFIRKKVISLGQGLLSVAVMLPYCFCWQKHLVALYKTTLAPINLAWANNPIVSR